MRILTSTASSRSIALLILGCIVCIASNVAAQVERRAAPPLDRNQSMEVAGEWQPRVTSKPQFELRNAPSQAKVQGVAKAPLLKIGGADQILDGNPTTREQLGSVDMDIADNGWIFEVSRTDFVGTKRLLLHRSKDGGTTWEIWKVLNEPSSTIYSHPRILVTHGPNSRVILVYTKWVTGSPSTIECISYDLATSAILSQNTPLSSSTIDFRRASLVADDESFNGYFVYLVAEANDSVNGNRIFFTRSVDLTATWETGYAIGNADFDSGSYPDISYGFGGWILVGWTSQPVDQSTTSTEVRFRRAASYADAGIGAWDPVQSLTQPTDSEYGFHLRVAASQVSNAVVMAWLRGSYSATFHAAAIEGTSLTSSTDNGATWQAVDSTTLGNSGFLNRLVSVPGSDQWVASGITSVTDRRIKIWRIAGSPVPIWATPQEMGDYEGSATLDGSALALDPTHSNQIAIVGTDDPLPGGFIEFLAFDAEWRSAPGYPVFDSGFPVTLTHSPSGANPILANIDNDPQSEILFGDLDGQVWAYNHDGTVVSGWPVAAADTVVTVAAADLTGDGRLAIVASTLEGQVFAYSPDGGVLPGWPITVTAGTPAFVSLGRVGPYHPNDIVIAGGQTLEVRDYKARVLQQWPPFDPTAPYYYSAAIGDIDNDGTNEIVAYTQNTIGIAAVGNPVLERSISGFSGGKIRAPISLGDLDLNGDLEMVVPVEPAAIHVLHSNGSEMAGWPWTGTVGVFSQVCVANIAGNSVPELAFREGESLHLMATNQVEQLGYPKLLGNGFILGLPTVGRVEGASNDVLVPSLNWTAIQAFSNLGASIPGWPHHLSGWANPAMLGDIDLDGHNEVVVLGRTELDVFDVNTAPDSNPARRWPMAGYDARQSYCANCPQDIVTATNPEPTITRVSFANPTPNPSVGRVGFRYTLPGRALIHLEVFDVRGRRIRNVATTEAEAGVHDVFFDNRDSHAQPLSSGRYFARLQVQGPGVSQTLTRKFTVLK